MRHALRHRPVKIVVGEVRGGEAADLLQALNTGHFRLAPAEGFKPTAPRASSQRLASCAVTRCGVNLPWDVTCRLVVDGIAMVIQHDAIPAGRRFVMRRPHVYGATTPGSNQLGMCTVSNA